MFYFKLHPAQWVFKNDATTRYRALELADGTYLVSWQSEDGKTIEVAYTSEEVTESIAKQHWVIEE